MASAHNTRLLSRDIDWFVPSGDHPQQVFQVGVLSSFDGVHRQHQDLLRKVIADTPDQDPSQVLVIIAGSHEEDSRQELLSLEERALLMRDLISEKLTFALIEGDLSRGNHKVQKEHIFRILKHMNRLVSLHGGASEKSMRNLAMAQDIPFHTTGDKEPLRSRTAQIKDAVSHGDVDQANRLLGYAYSLEGMVVKGNMIGRTLGYPTANLKPQNPHKILPGQGVYAAMVHLEGNWHRAMINIGIRPTLDLDHVTIEAHLLDFHGDLYGREISFHFLERMRNEMRFSSLSHLKEQLRTDRQATERRLENLHHQYVPSGRWLVRS